MIQRQGMTNKQWRTQQELLFQMNHIQLQQLKTIIEAEEERKGLTTIA